MIQDKQLLEKFHNLPSDKQSEVIDFIEFLESKTKKSSEVESQDSESRRLYGVLDGKVWMSDDFDEPLEEFAEYM